MKYYLIAGERSGDLHTANLMKAIQKEDSEAEFRYFGGDEMQKVGGELVRHYRDMAFMGLVEVIRNLQTIKKYLKECKADILNYQPDVVILIDYAGFNLRIAKFAKENNLSVFYYISPKVWAWNTKRAYKIKKNVDQLFTILPFETSFFQQFDYTVNYVGNPLLDAINAFQANPDFKKENNLENKEVIALLPGSRKQELRKLLPVMVEVTKQFSNYHFVVAGVHNLPSELYETAQNLPNVSIIWEQTYDLLTIATAAIVTSGTATLETGIFKVPQVVIYKTNPITYSVGIRVVKIEHFSLVNLVAEKEVVKELLQKEVTPITVAEELKAILPKGEKREQVLINYEQMLEKLGETGASGRAGKLMVEYLRKNISIIR